MDMCTGSAKAIYTKSRRYEANFELMCKSLQQNVTIDGIAERAKRLQELILTAQVIEKTR
jgi:hypothetical protein